MSKKINFLIFVLLLILIGCQQPEEELQEEHNETGQNQELIEESSEIELAPGSIAIPLNTDHQVTFISEEVEFNEVDVAKAEYTTSSDIAYEYELIHGEKSAGRLLVTVRTLDNDDIFVFTRLDNKLEEPISVTAALSFDEVNRYQLTDFDQYLVEREHDSTLGVDPTTGPIGLLDFYSFDEHQYSFFASKNYLSTQLSHEYDNGGFSTLRELVDEVKDFTVSTSGETISVELPLQSGGSDISENWFIVSDERMFEDENNLQNWITHMLQNYFHANKWLAADGNYRKLPWSIEPFTRLGYGRNPGSMQDKAAIDSYEHTGERFFYNLTMNSVAMLEAYVPEDKKVWITEYTSTWLKNSYETIAPFVDTRHNENIALFLTRVGHLFDIEDLKDAHVDYADFLIDQVEKGNTFAVGEDSFLIADYYSPHPGTIMTHASLNHVIGEVNFLLDSYILKREDQYLDLAYTLRRAVEDIGEDWIRESGDLWYQVNPDLTFDGNDYEQLTLSDLLYSQEKWEEAGQERSELFDKLIYSKTEYLVAKNTNLLSYIIEMLEDQGFGELLK